jgi:transposase
MEALMRKQLYWLSDEEWCRIEHLLPRGRRGAHRVDDRRVISGIVHMLRSGARWRDCPPEYGPYTTIYNRFNRWSRQGIWLDMFKALTGSTGLFGMASIDSSHAKAHRSAAGGKGGTSSKPSGARAAAARPRSTR